MKIFWLPFCCMFVLKQVHMLLYFVFGLPFFDEDDEDGNGKIFLYDIFISNYCVCLPAVRIYLIFSYDFKPCNNVTTLPIIIFMWYLQICLGYLSCWDIIVGHTQKVQFLIHICCLEKNETYFWRVLVLKVEFRQMWNFLPNLCSISFLGKLNCYMDNNR